MKVKICPFWSKLIKKVQTYTFIDKIRPKSIKLSLSYQNQKSKKG